MKIALLSLVLFFSNQVLVLAQEQHSNISIFSVQDVNVQLGFITGGNTRLSLEEFKLFAPKSELLNNELWEKSDRRGLMVSVKGLFSMQMGIHFGDKQKMKYKSNPFLRLGFTYYSGMSFAGDFELKERHSSDTLQSGQTGQQILIDSITNSTLRCRYRLQQLRLDASLIFRTNPAAILIMPTTSVMNLKFSLMKIFLLFQFTCRWALISEWGEKKNSGNACTCFMK